MRRSPNHRHPVRQNRLGTVSASLAKSRPTSGTSGAVLIVQVPFRPPDFPDDFSHRARSSWILSLSKSLSSDNGGKSSSFLESEIIEKLLRVVPNIAGFPGTSRWPTTRIQFRSSNVRVILVLTATPRISSISPRVTGCRYTMIDKRLEQCARITRRPLFPQLLELMRHRAADLNPETRWTTSTSSIPRSAYSACKSIIAARISCRAGASLSPNKALQFFHSQAA